MRNASLAALATSLTLTACMQAGQPLTPADETAVRAVMTGFVAAANANNIVGMTAPYASDAAVHPNGMPAAVGTAAIHQMWTDMEHAIRLTSFAFPTSRVAGQGDVAWITGTYRLAAVTTDSAATPLPQEDGKFVTVLLRQEDKSWKIVADSWNTNAMPGAAAAPAAPALPASRR